MGEKLVLVTQLSLSYMESGYSRFTRENREGRDREELLSVPLPNDTIEKVSLFTGSEVSTIFSKPYSTDVLTQEQVIFLAQQLPSPKATTGRPAYSNQELLPGILRVLRSG